MRVSPWQDSTRFWVYNIHFWCVFCDEPAYPQRRERFVYWVDCQRCGQGYLVHEAFELWAEARKELGMEVLTDA